MRRRQGAVDNRLVCGSRRAKGERYLLAGEIGSGFAKAERRAVEGQIHVARIDVVAELPAQVVRDRLELRAGGYARIRKRPQENRAVLLSDPLRPCQITRIR